MSGAGLPIFSDDLGLRSSEKLEVPDEWGKSPDVQVYADKLRKYVLIPD